MMRATVLSVLVIGALLASAAALRSRGRIAGGSAATPEEYPFVVNMQHHFLSAWWAHQCGGTLVTSRLVVSSSSCFSGTTPSEWRARVGAAAAAGEGAILAVQGILLHEQFDDVTLDYDVALVTLQDAALLSGNVGVALIAGANYILPDGAIVSALGWGRLWEEGPYAETLQYASSALFSQAECEARMAVAGRSVTPRMLCAAGLDAGVGACAADWGGPLAHMSTQGPVLVGVLSWSKGCGDTYYPFVSARVSELSAWILANAP